ncbi:hypothetical protein CVIRNUC_002599 [Coccomyxa viridis]|uniref:Uncharacterized protein n=1 Tax=Coccomyxa viridis TaxID=1274662 RepID=A0AAV1HZF0_9CHLO|nr:hypothetical protein CVIRNUC_002599 [Coccomyxa viridis]
MRLHSESKGAPIGRRQPTPCALRGGKRATEVHAQTAATKAPPPSDGSEETPTSVSPGGQSSATGTSVDKEIEQRQDAASKAEPTDGRKRKPHPLKGRKRPPVAGKGIEQKQDAAGEAEPTDGQKRKPHSLKGRKRPPGLGVEKT